MVKDHSIRSRKFKAFTKLVALISLKYLLLQFTLAQEEGVVTFGQTPVTRPLTLGASTKPNVVSVTPRKPTIPSSERIPAKVAPRKPTTPSPLLSAASEPGPVWGMPRQPTTPSPPLSTTSRRSPVIVIPKKPTTPSPLSSTTSEQGPRPPDSLASTMQSMVTRPLKNKRIEQNHTKARFRTGSEEEIIHCKDGLILTYWRPLEGVSKTERILRGIIYLLAMSYLLFGIAIASNRFMESIEVITSHKKRVTVLNNNGKQQTIYVRVWSQTVASLTLIALGSSAPEIFLPIIEMFQKNFEAGDLGPGTIVGSAAFKLFIIIAVCIVVVPRGEVRKIHDLRVFVVTCIWSIFAYIWLCLIVKFITPGVIDVWEGLLTFIFFPILVCHAYVTERRFFCPKCYNQSYETDQHKMAVNNVEATKQSKASVATSIKDLVESPEMRDFEEARRQYITKLKELRRKYPQYDLEKIQAMAHEQLIKSGSKSRAFYRVQSGRRLLGTPGVMRNSVDMTAEETSEAKAEVYKQREENGAFYEDYETYLYFSPFHYTVMESVGDMEVHVIRGGNLKYITKVEYYTENGTGLAGKDYIAARGVLEFAPGIDKQTIKLTIIDDDVFGGDVHFYVHLKNPSAEAVLVTPKVATIMILDDDLCGVFGFEETEHQFAETVNVYEILVKRYSGALGKVIVPYYTKEKTAISGKDYIDVSGKLVFEHGIVELPIKIEIIDEHSYEKDVVFEVYLGEPSIAEATA